MTRTQKIAAISQAIKSVTHGWDPEALREVATNWADGQKPDALAFGETEDAQAERDATIKAVEAAVG